jgi:transposase
MYFRDSIRRYKDRSYHSLQLVECYRHAETRRPTTKVIASLGDLSCLETKDRIALVVSLARGLGVLDLVKLSSEEIALADISAATSKAQSVGAVWAVLELMRQLHIPQIWESLVSEKKNAKSLAKHLTALLCNRIDDPGSKLSLLRWLETVLVPGIDRDDINYQGLLRTMDVLLEHKSDIEKALAERMLTLFDMELDLVLIDVTSVAVHTTAEDHALFAHGYSRDGLPEQKQYVLAMVTTKDGVPLYHEVHRGNTADVTLVEGVLSEARKLFPDVDRCMVVGDRGMLSEDNVVALARLGFEHLVAMPLKREVTTREIIEQTHDELMRRARKEAAKVGPDEAVPEVVTEVEVDGGRVIVAYSMAVAERQRRERVRKLTEFEERAALIEARLTGEQPHRGRPLTDQGAFKQLIKEALRKKVTAYFRIEMRGEFLWVEPVEEAEEYAEKCDGKLALHIDNPDLSDISAYRVYKDMQEIERSWRALKSALRIRPSYHWTESRVRAHAFLCVLALVVERVMRLKLKAARSDYSPQSALEELRKLTHVTLHLPADSKQWNLLANKTPEQLQLFSQLDIDPLTDARLRQLVS